MSRTIVVKQFRRIEQISMLQQQSLHSLVRSEEQFRPSCRVAGVFLDVLHERLGARSGRLVRKTLINAGRTS